jgi:predicted amidohydrolase YtcJ
MHIKTTLAFAILASTFVFAAEPPAAADLAYRNGVIYTVDATDSVQEALAVKDGRILYVGANGGLGAFVTPATKIIDLKGRLLMPGLVDGHIHPLEGGAKLLDCSLNYERLTIAAMQAKVQSCLDAGKDGEPDAWLFVVNWFQEGMLPAGTLVSRELLDGLKTHRPILVESSFGHSSLANSRALKIAGITSATKSPADGNIVRDASGQPTGLLDDAAQDLVRDKMPKATAEDDVKAARAALEVMKRQGITSFLDAKASPETLAAFSKLQKAGALTSRAHFALLISPPEGRDPIKATQRVTALAHRYDSGELLPKPGITVRHIKLFLDGVISAPALSGAMLEPYFEPPAKGATTWSRGKNRGPEVYFPAPVLAELLKDVVAAGFEPHMHADGDRAVHEGLDAAAKIRSAFPGRDVRFAIAHDEIVSPDDFARFKLLNVIPVVSFQWGKPASDTIEYGRDYLGPQRFRYVEPAGFLDAAGARVAYGSDWPVDPLDEWFALKVGVTRTNAPDSGYSGRLGEDPGLSRQAVLRAITMNSSYELHQEDKTGSLEVGKFADFIVLDRNVLSIPAEQIADVKVLQTVVGGQLVFQHKTF